MPPELASSLTAFAQVLLIDITLAGDNAIVVGLAVAGLPEAQRNRAILWGIGAAAVIRIGFATVTLQLLQIVGLMLAGGILLLWVCWRMYRELAKPECAPSDAGAVGHKSFAQAMAQILLADISMSLDNVLAVAGAAEGHLWVLVAGLAISVVLMGLAARLISGLLERYRWIAWAGLLVVAYVAVKLIWEGSGDVAQHWAAG